jgi:hypothetical protein
MADPALGNIPAVFRDPYQTNDPMAPRNPTQQPGYVNPRNALWGGYLSDMANHFLSGRRAGFQGLGPQSMFQAIRGNQQIEQNYRQEQWRQLQMRQQQAQMMKPVPVGNEGDYMQYNPQTNQWDMNITSERGLGVGGDSTKSWAYDILRSGNYDPDSSHYRTAFEILYNPQTRVDPATGQEYVIKPQVPNDIVSPPGWAPQTDQGSGVGGKPAKPPTGDESKAFGFYKRMIPAAQVMTELENNGYRPSQLEWQSFKRMPDLAISSFGPEAQRYFRAVDSYVRAKLRRESGAAISAKEYEDETRGTIILPGVEGDVIRDIQQERFSSVEGILYGAGYAAQQMPEVKAEIETYKQTLMQTGMSEEAAESIATDVAVQEIAPETRNNNRSAGSTRRGNRGRRARDTGDPNEMIEIEGLD